MINFLEFSSLYDLQKAFPTEESCVKYLERIRWNGEPVSPFHKYNKVYKCKNNKYKCGMTDKYFNVKTGTIFQDTRLPLTKWFMAMYLIATDSKGISSLQLAKNISVRKSTAWFLLQRIRYGMGQGSWVTLSGTIEADEAFFGANPKNKHKKDRDGGMLQSQRVNHKIAIGIVQRGGKAVIKHIPNVKDKTIVPVVNQIIEEGSTLYTDERGAYVKVKKAGEHKSVNHRNKEFTRGTVHTNTVENIWSTLKRGIYGTYHWTSHKHFQAYLNEFAFRYNNRQGSEYNKVNQCIIGANKGTLKYKTLIGKK